MLAARDIAVTYAGGVRALDGVSLRVPRGEVTGLLGPNGAGKSTLLRVLATLQRPASGGVVVAGIDALAEPARARAHIGYLPQEFGFPPALTSAELLDHFALLKGFGDPSARREAVRGMLDRVNLTADRDRAVRALSGGMRQQLGIAVALIGAPDVLIVDEPTVALDPSERHRIHDLLIELAADRAVLLSTHLVADVEALCHTAVVLHAGRIVREGPPAQLAAALAGRIHRARLPRADGIAARATMRVIREFLVSGAMEVTVLADAPPDPRFTTAVPTLDDVFAEATAR
ncbi:MAG: ATP-binding cassette domain-containing protein [Gemmatimonadaceae bacterium]|nr:ATP-binding cassette domain-containing protein [Gemmatimonadaceae bacterium]